MRVGVFRLDKTLRRIHPAIVMLLFLAGILLGLDPAWRVRAADGAGADERKLKAALVFNFPKFVEWPPGADKYSGDPIRLCILGADPLSEELMALNSKKIGDRPLVVSSAKEIEGVRDCQIVFIGASERANIEAVLKALKGESVLTISDMDHFVESGGVIGLIEVDERVRFEVNLAAARSARLEISSKLLKLADKVIENH